MKMFLDFFLTDGNKGKQLEKFLEIASLISRSQRILNLPITDNFIAQTTKDEHFSFASSITAITHEPNIDDYLKAFPDEHRNVVDQEIKTLGNRQRKIELIRRKLTELEIDYSELEKNAKDLLTIKDYLTLVKPEQQSIIEQELKYLGSTQEKIEFIKAELTRLGIEPSKVRPTNLNSEAYKNNLLIQLEREQVKFQEKAIEKILNDLTIDLSAQEKEQIFQVSKSLDIDSFRAIESAIAYSNIAHNNSPDAQKLIKQIILDFLGSSSVKLDKTIRDKAKDWIKSVEKENPNFNSDKLRKPFSQQIGDYKLEIETDPVKYFLMSDGLEDQSCLALKSTVGNADKVLNHALNLHTLLIWIKDLEDNYLARQLVTVLDNGQIDGYPIYLFDRNASRDQIKEISQQFAERYHAHLGMKNKTSTPPKPPSSLFDVPAYYDGAIWSVSEHSQANNINQANQE